MTASDEKTNLTFVCKRREYEAYRTSDTGCNRYFLQFSTFVAEVGALADLLLIDGNSLEDINLVTNRG
jgi:hypothetical protein